MKKAVRNSLIVLLIGGVATLVLVLRPGKSTFSGLKGRRDLNFILVTVDTLRADRIGCYGFSGIETPNIDAFAANGVKFERCISPAPLTLPSHTSILTGTLPMYHGVRDNGGFLVPTALPTLAETFKERGYQTAAFVAAYVLDSKWGLKKGFDFYFDKFDLSRYKSLFMSDVQRRADEVIDETLKWLDVHKEKKFFGWLHLYDPHIPYDPPSPFDKKYAKMPYLGEIAFVDEQLGRLWRYLKDHQLDDNTVLVFTSDHGESLGQHEEESHGYFIYQTTVHVPLIFVTPFQRLKNISREPVVSLTDIMPTILDMAGFPPAEHVQGKSLVPLFFNALSRNPELAYSETYYPRFHYGWSELKAVQDRRFKLILAPSQELYDLQSDPEEITNLADKNPEQVDRLKNAARVIIGDSSRNAFKQDHRHLDAESIQKLASLGYVGGFTDRSPSTEKYLADPKNKIGVFNRIEAAKMLGLEGQIDKAAGILKEIIRTDPEIHEVYTTLGNVYLQGRKFSDSLACFYKALEQNPEEIITIINIAKNHISMRKLDEAEKIISDSLQFAPADSMLYFYLGSIKKMQMKYPEAIGFLKKGLELNPYAASGYNELGAISIIENRLDEAEGYLEKARAINPQLLNLHYNRAMLFEKKGDRLRAVQEYTSELANSPSNFRAAFNLSIIYRDLGDVVQEEKYLRTSIEAKSDLPLSYFYLARILLHQKRDLREAVEFVNRGLALNPEKRDLALGHFLLADLYNRLGDDALSRQHAQIGKNLMGFK